MRVGFSSGFGLWFFSGRGLVFFGCGLWFFCRIWIGFSSDVLVFQDRIGFSELDTFQVLRVLNWLHIIVKAAEQNVTDKAEVLFKMVNK